MYCRGYVLYTPYKYMSPPIDNPWIRRRRGLALLAALAAASPTGVLRAQVAKSSPLTALPTVTVQAVSQAPRAEFEGLVEPVRQAVVAAQASGRILSVSVRAGDPVRVGQVLVVIDDRDAAAGVDRVRAQAREADAALRQAQANWERHRQLRRQEFISQAALDNAEAQFKSAQAARDQVEAALAQAQLGQGHTRVTAPFDGFVREIQAEAGDLATPGRPLLTLYAPQPLRVIVRLGVSRQAFVRQATGVEVQAGDAEWIPIVQHQLLPAVDPVSQTQEWRLDLPRTGAPWAPGQQVRVRVRTAGATSAQTPARSLPQVPRSAVVRRGEISAVYVANGDAFVMRAVRVGREIADGLEIVAGLRAGERVAVDGLRAAQLDARPAP